MKMKNVYSIIYRTQNKLRPSLDYVKRLRYLLYPLFLGFIFVRSSSVLYIDLINYVVFRPAGYICVCVCVCAEIRGNLNKVTTPTDIIVFQ